MRSVLGSTAASVVSTASIVAIAGDSIAAPLAMPPMVATTPCATSTRCTVSLRTVSVVSMAVAAASPPAASALSAVASFGIPDSTGSIGIGIPISPVEQTSTSRGAQPSDSAVSSAMRSASRRPASPVAALALPELSTTAAARPSWRWMRLICTGAAATRLDVNTPVAATDA